MHNYEEIFTYYDDLKKRNQELKEEHIKSELQKNALEASKQKINNSGIGYGGTYKEIYNQKKSNLEDSLNAFNKKYNQIEEDLQNKYISAMKEAFNVNYMYKLGKYRDNIATISSWVSKLAI